MGRINQDIVEYSFSAKSTLSYELSLLVGTDSIYYMVNDAQLNVLALKSFHNDRKRDKTQLSTFKDAFFEDVLLKEPYRITKIVYTTPHFTLIPSKFYNDAQRSIYFENLTDRSENVVFEADSLKNIDFRNVYILDKQMLSFTVSTFPLAKQYHVFTALIQGCQKIAETRQGHQIFANIRDGFVQILFFDGKDLVFANAYPFQTPQDLIYYIMMVYEQFKLNPESIPLSISGNMTEDSDIFKYIYRYIRLVSFISAPSYFRLGQEFTGVPQHFYFDLFSIKLCE
jgi:Protein of unknown function (DUF3822)